jgi:hypothetical protein
MALHPEVAAWGIAAGMVDMCRRAASFAADRADQANLDAWGHALAAARGDAAEMADVAVAAVQRVVLLTAHTEDLEAENARLRALLAQRTATIRSLTQ